MWLEWIDEYDERGDSENDDVMCEVMRREESDNEKRREWYDEVNRKEEEMMIVRKDIG